MQARSTRLPVVYAVCKHSRQHKRKRARLAFDQPRQLRAPPQVLGDHGVELPNYYGQRFAGRRLTDDVTHDAYHTHFVGPTEFSSRVRPPPRPSSDRSQSHA